MPPFAGFKDFDSCVEAQKSDGKSDESSRKICGKLQSETKGANILSAIDYKACLDQAKNDFGLDDDAAQRVCSVIKSPKEDEAEDKLDPEDNNKKESSVGWYKSGSLSQLEEIDNVIDNLLGAETKEIRLDAAFMGTGNLEKATHLTSTGAPDKIVSTTRYENPNMTGSGNAVYRTQTTSSFNPGGAQKRELSPDSHSLATHDQVVSDLKSQGYKEKGSAEKMGESKGTMNIGRGSGGGGGNWVTINGHHVLMGGSLLEAADKAIDDVLLDSAIHPEQMKQCISIKMKHDSSLSSDAARSQCTAALKKSSLNLQNQFTDPGKLTNYENNQNIIDWNSDAEADYNEKSPTKKIDLSYYDDDVGKCVDEQQKNGLSVEDARKFCSNLANSLGDSDVKSDDQLDPVKYENREYIPGTDTGSHTASTYSDMEQKQVDELDDALKIIKKVRDEEEEEAKQGSIPLLSESELAILDAARDTSSGGRHPDSGKYVTGHGENNLKSTHSHGYPTDGPNTEGDMPNLDNNDHLKKQHPSHKMVGSYLMGFGGGFNINNTPAEDEPADQEAAEEAGSGTASASLNDFIDELEQYHSLDDGDTMNATVEDIIKEIEELKSAYTPPSERDDDPLEDEDTPQEGEPPVTGHDENNFETHTHDFGTDGPSYDHFGDAVVDEASLDSPDSYTHEQNSNLDDNDHINSLTHPAHADVADDMSDIPEDNEAMSGLGMNSTGNIVMRKGPASATSNGISEQTAKAESPSWAPQGAAIKSGEDYPWDKCISDNGGGESAEKICGSIKAKYGGSTDDGFFDKLTGAFKSALETVIGKKSEPEIKSASVMNQIAENAGAVWGVSPDTPIVARSNTGWIRNGKAYSATQCEIDMGSDEEAKSVCNYIGQNYNGSYDAYIKDIQIKPFESNNKLFIKAFLMDSSINQNRWGVHPETLDANIMSYIGKPLVLQSNFDHPISSDDNLQHQLEYQQLFSIGPIIDIVKKGSRYDAIAEITDNYAQKAFREGELPLYVSPQLYKTNSLESDSQMKGWTGTHLAIVKEPAFGVKRATVNGECTGEHDKCLSYLRKAAIIKKHGYGSCGYCNYKVLSSARPEDQTRSAATEIPTPQPSELESKLKQYESFIEQIDKTMHTI